MQLILNEPFEILLVWSETTILVASDQTALAVLLKAGVPVEPGCMTGGCGSCATRYIDGDVIHKDACLSASDREQEFCPCVSRARGVLVLPF
jgi:vanillate O-demethylase ferredoxin subunit